MSVGSPLFCLVFFCCFVLFPPLDPPLYFSFLFKIHTKWVFCKQLIYPLTFCLLFLILFFFLVFGFWFLVLGFGFWVFGFWFLVFGFFFSFFRFISKKKMMKRRRTMQPSALELL